jgi:anti-sigma28 factor (negative regulator of flagellin synthesis)
MDFRQDHEAVSLPSRVERLQELAREIAEGTYRIPAEWVAEAILTWRGRSGRRN